MLRPFLFEVDFSFLLVWGPVILPPFQNYGKREASTCPLPILCLPREGASSPTTGLCGGQHAEVFWRNWGLFV